MKPDGKEHWFVAYTRSCQERKAAEMLSRLGVRSFIASQKVKRQWSDRVKLVDQILIPHIIFVRALDSERVDIIGRVPYMTRYMSSGKGAFDPAVVPDVEMEAFMLMLSQTEVPVTIVSDCFVPGQKVKVVKGPLSGVVAGIVSVDSRTQVSIDLSILGAAVAEISLEDIVPAE